MTLDCAKYASEIAGPFVTPYTLYSVYNYSDYKVTDARSSLSLMEFAPGGCASFYPKSLASFLEQNDIAPNTVAADHLIGSITPAPGVDGGYETNLDVQYAMASAQNVTTWFWTSDGWMYEAATDVTNKDDRPLVLSISWGNCEIEACSVGSSSSECEQEGVDFEVYIQRTETQWKQLGVMGTTIVVASGDNGAPGRLFNTQDSCNYPTPLNPAYPASSAYVLSVGATALTEAIDAPSSHVPAFCKTAFAPCAVGGVEVVANPPIAIITSGGGFSVVIPRPSWQDAAVEAYLTNPEVSLPSATYFNKSNRGYPDMAVLGHNYLVEHGLGNACPVDGTSCAAPVTSGIIALMNSERFKAGKPPVGFINPLIYQLAASNPEVFQDVTSGNNKETEECKSPMQGFVASTGWDATTGLGTPNVGRLIPLVVAAAS